MPRLSDRLRRDLVGANSDPLLVKAFAKFRRRFELRTPLTTEDDLAECRREYLSYVVEGSDEVTYLFSDQLDSDIRTDPDGDSARYKKPFLAAVLARIRETVSRHGAPLVVLVIPAPVDVCDTYDARDVDPRKHPAYRRSALTDTLVQAAAAADIPAVDLYPI